MSRRLKKIGTAIFDIVGFINFRLQETKGNVSLGELGTYVNQQVRQHSIMEIGKSQSPTINISNSLAANWKSMTLK